MVPVFRVLILRSTQSVKTIYPSSWDITSRSELCGFRLPERFSYVKHAAVYSLSSSSQHQAGLRWLQNAIYHLCLSVVGLAEVK